MNSIIKFLRHTITGGLFFMIPLFVVLVIAGKIWAAMKGIGDKITEILGFHPTWLGIGTGIAATILIVVAICFVSGLLIRVTVMDNLRNNIDRFLVRSLPGYEFYKISIEKKLSAAAGSDPRPAALITMDGVGQPGLIIEELSDKRLVVFISSKPGTPDGQVYVVQPSAVERINTDEAAMNVVLRHQGKGLDILLRSERLK